MKKGKIVYKFTTPHYPNPNILYINLIARYSCTNDCLFCSRPRKKEDIGKGNIYEKKAQSFLYLSKSPSIKRIMDELDKKIKKTTEEIAIIGLGEPLIYFKKIVRLLKEIRKKYPEEQGYKYKTRVDTNGLVKCMFDDPIKKLEEAGLENIRISLNAINEQEYNQLCRPKFHNAFPDLVSFVREGVNSSIDTLVSFVTDFEHEKLKKRTGEEYIEFAKSLGVKDKNIILRKYIKD